jgi:hypothetical protein
MSEPSHHTEADGLDQFIPVSKRDLLDALTEQGAFADAGEREEFRRLGQTLAAIYHYEYLAQLEGLRNDYYYFSPEVARRTTRDAKSLESDYADLIRSLDEVLKNANFVEVPHADIDAAHRERRALRVEVRAPLNDFREVRFYRRGRHRETVEVSEWFGLRKRKIELDVYDDVVLFVALKPDPDPERISRRQSRQRQRRNIVPGSVLLKYFHNISASDLNALFPNVRVVMSKRDKLVLGVPALASGVPILLKLYATIAVLFVVAGFYLGLGQTVRDKDLETAVAALGGLLALAAFAMTQWTKYQRQSLKYQVELTNNVYYRNINNNAGIFDYIVGAAEDQETKEAFLAYYFIYTAAEPPTADELDGRIEAWLKKACDVEVDFAVDGALQKLERLGLLRRQAGLPGGPQGERLFVSPPQAAYTQLRAVWAGFLAPEATKRP